MKSRQEISAGGVVYRRNRGLVEILICKDAGYHRWVLPKGLVRKSEAMEQTAVREVEEEVGVRARVVASLDEPEKYIYTARGVRVFKQVHYFLMEYEAGSETQHDAEMEEVRWVPLEEAVELLAYKGAQDVVKRCKALLDHEGVS
jgi:8-oxo-dGTP pyrophosphatase MutT (NUDIX family)